MLHPSSSAAAEPAVPATALSDPSRPSRRRRGPSSLRRGALALFFASSLSLCLPSPASAAAASSVANVACTRRYVVQSGDTCDEIGQKTMTSTYQIMALNLPDAGPDCFSLSPGQELCLGRYGSDCQVVHVCRSSDTCASVAASYGVSTALLASNNPTLDCDNVYDGLVLCTAPGNVAPPKPEALTNAYLNLGRRAGNGSAAQHAAEAERREAQAHAHAQRSHMQQHQHMRMRSH